MSWLDTRTQPFSWSFSRGQVYGTCPRRYYYRYYAPYGGNAPREPGDRTLIYLLGRLATAPMLIGRVVHELAHDSLQAAATGRPWAEGTLAASARVAMTRLLRSSRRAVRRCEAGHPPRQVSAILDDHYYRLDFGARETGAALERAVHYAEGLAGHPLYALALRRPMTMLSVESAGSIGVGGVQVVAVPDLVLRMDDGRVAVVDWKTGASVEERADQHAAQLATYALYAARQWGQPEERLACLVADLNGTAVLEFPLGEGGLQRAEEAIAASIALLRGALDDRGRNIASPRRFPPLAEREASLAELPWACGRCPYRLLCYGDRVIGWVAG